ncbi:MAG: hypothetical protein ACI4VW_08885 [Acutalibacteraceae bacterium]
MQIRLGTVTITGNTATYNGQKHTVSVTGSIEGVEKIPAAVVYEKKTGSGWVVYSVSVRILSLKCRFFCLNVNSSL